jgi:hypothetical protein
MPEIALEGFVYRVFRSSKKPVVFIAEKDHERLYEWWEVNHIDTKLESLFQPSLKARTPQISAETTAKDIEDGTRVKITIDSQTRMRKGKTHIGIRTMSIKTMGNAE